MLPVHELGRGTPMNLMKYAPWLVLLILAGMVGAVTLLRPPAIDRGPRNVLLIGKTQQAKGDQSNSAANRQLAANKEKEQRGTKEAECSNDGQSYHDCLIQLRTARATERQAKISKSTERVAWFALLFAAMAAGAAWWTVKVMRDTAKRQLKAYVAMGDAFMRFSTANTQRSAEIALRLKNAGQTPGYNFTTWCNSKIDLPSARPFTAAPPPDKRAGISIIGPSSSVDLTMYIIGIDDPTLDDLVHGRKRIYAWGRCDYVDIYGVDRYFEFKCWNGTSFVDSRCGVSPHPEGYQAN